MYPASAAGSRIVSAAGTLVTQFGDPSSGGNVAPFLAWGDLTSFDVGHGHYSVIECEIDPQLTPVPVPSTFLLFGSGLIALVGSRRWRSTKIA